jgi:hypothetical protein
LAKKSIVGDSAVSKSRPFKIGFEGRVFRKQFFLASFTGAKVMANATQNRNLPIETFRIGSVSLCIFENQSTAEGKTQKFYRGRVEKSYRDQTTGQWKSTNSFSLDELLRLRCIVDKAIDFMVAKPIPAEKQSVAPK